MFSPQNRLKVIVKPYPIPKSPHSANSSPRACRSTEFAASEKFPTSPKPSCSQILKTLDDLSFNFQSAIKKNCNSEQNFLDLIENCDKTVKLTRLKVMEAGAVEGMNKVETKTESGIFKTGPDEYSNFLEYLLTYEQKKSEVIVDKAKFPKVRMKEVERTLNDEFGLKPASMANIVKIKEISFCDQAKKEIKEIQTRIVKKLKDHCALDLNFENEEVEKFDSKNLADERMKLQKFIGLGNSFIESLKKAGDEVNKYKSDSEKITVKYNYLICKFNKQDSTLKKQSKILSFISNDTNNLKYEVANMVSEFKEFFHTLVDTMSKKSLSRVSGMEMYKEQKKKWDDEKEEMTKDYQEIKEKSLMLEKKLKKSFEEIIKLRSELEKEKDDTLELNSNINDIIEIQKLKDQLRLLTFKSNDAIEQFRREKEILIENIAKLKDENYELERKLRVLTLKIGENSKEEEDKGDGVRVRPALYLEPAKTPLQSSMETLSVGEISSDPSVRINDLFEMLKDEIEEIAQGLRDHKVFHGFYGNNIEIIRKSSNFLIKLKENLSVDPSKFEETIESLILNHRTKSNPKDISSNKTFTDSTSLIKDKEIESYKEKLKGRKSQIGLLKLQMNYLKKTVESLKSELKKRNHIDIECVKGMIINIFKEVPRLPGDTENLITMFMENLGLTSEDIQQLKSQRKNRRGLF